MRTPDPSRAASAARHAQARFAQTWEVSRHTLLVGLFTRLGVLLLALFALDAFLARERRRGTGEPPAGGR